MESRKIYTGNASEHWLFLYLGDNRLEMSGKYIEGSHGHSKRCGGFYRCVITRDTYDSSLHGRWGEKHNDDSVSTVGLWISGQIDKVYKSFLDDIAERELLK